MPAALLCELAGAYLPGTIVHITYSLDAIWSTSGPTWAGEHLEQWGDISGRIDCRGGRHLGAPAHQPPAHPQLPPRPTTRMPKFHIVKGPLGKQLSSQTKVT